MINKYNPFADVNKTIIGTTKHTLTRDSDEETSDNDDSD